MVRWAIWYHLHNLKNVKKAHGGVLFLVKPEACNFTKSNTPPWMFFTFLKLYKRYQIAQSITHDKSQNYLKGKPLTHSFPRHPFSTLWKHQKIYGVEEGCIGNEWVNILNKIDRLHYWLCIRKYKVYKDAHLVKTKCVTWKPVARV